MIVFDLDGTLRDLTHRLHFIQGKADWDAFYRACGDDAPIQHMLENLKAFAKTEKVMIWSGCSDVARKTTEKWLWDHAKIAVLPEMHSNWKHPDPEATLVEALWMREDGDFTKDCVLKEQWLDHYRLYEPGDPISLVFDDRQKVVDMWRRNGIRCVQVAPGDF